MKETDNRKNNGGNKNAGAKRKNDKVKQVGIYLKESRIKELGGNTEIRKIFVDSLK